MRGKRQLGRLHGMTGQGRACGRAAGKKSAGSCGAPQVRGGKPVLQYGWSLLPPHIAFTRRSSQKRCILHVFRHCAVGLLYANFSFEGPVLHVFQGCIVSVLSDAYNVGILVFLVVLGTMVCMMNKAGGSAAFGRWAQTHIKSRVGAQLATVALGCLIFIDDYFNCLTVGSVMRPVTDKHRVSRAKLAYIIDATAAPVCIIAPISSWAAAVSGFVEDGKGLSLFIRAIPYNFYALFTIAMMVMLVVLRVDYGPMAKSEALAGEGDLFGGGPDPYAGAGEAPADKGRVVDLIAPIAVLIFCCVVGMVYSGGFFAGGEGGVLARFSTAFSNSDASVGLMLGSAFALVFSFVYYMLRRAMSFREMMGCIPDGFKAMVPAIMILTFAWSLKAMTDSLGAKYFVRDLVKSGAEGMQMFLPAIVFLIGCLLAFATGQAGERSACSSPSPWRSSSGRPHGHRVHCRMYGGRRVRQPLFADLRHNDHGLCGRPVRPCPACLHTTALCNNGGSRFLHLLCGGGSAGAFRAAGSAGAAVRVGSDGRFPALEEKKRHTLPHIGTKGRPRRIPRTAF
jgi:Na+/H+ antiporter NhaC